MNQRIDHTNYEAFLLDRMEGNLSPERSHELEAFLIINPELAPDDRDLPAFRTTTLTLSEVDKEAMKRKLPPTGMPGEEPLDDLLIAHMEGDLTDAQGTALAAYLIAHPELRSTERLYVLAKIAPEDLVFAEKQDLTRKLPPLGMPDRRMLDDFLVARMEGDLNREQEEAIATLIAKEPALERQWDLYQRTRVNASVMNYPHKAELKKEAKVISIGRIPWTRLAAAASIAMLIGWGVWYLRMPTVDPPGIVEVPAAPVPLTKEIQHDAAPVAAVPEGTIASAIDATKVSEKKDQPLRSIPSKGSTPLRALPSLRHEEPLPMAEQRPVVPTREVRAPPPLDVMIPDVPVASEDALAERHPIAPSSPSEMSLRGLLVSTVREQVLEKPAHDTRAIDGDDAVAMVDLGLKAVGGERAGLDVTRQNDGALRGFNLRLGRNLSITAGR